MNLSVNRSTHSETVVGFNAGVDGRYMFMPNVGAGAMIRFTRGKGDLTADGQTLESQTDVAGSRSRRVSGSSSNDSSITGSMRYETADVRIRCRHLDSAFTMACSASNPVHRACQHSIRPPRRADGTTLKASAPTAVSPAGGDRNRRPRAGAVINNSTATFAPGVALTYVFEVLNSANQVIYRSNPVAQGSGGRTTHEIAYDIES